MVSPPPSAVLLTPQLVLSLHWQGDGDEGEGEGGNTGRRADGSGDRLVAGPPCRPCAADGWRRPDQPNALRWCCSTQLMTAWRAGRPAEIQPSRANGCRDKLVAAVVAVDGSDTCALKRRAERARARILPWSVLAAAAA